MEEIERKRANKQEFLPPPEDLVRMFFECVEPKLNCSYAVLPYIKGLTEPLKRLLKQHDIRVTSKPLYTLEKMFPSPKDRPPPKTKLMLYIKLVVRTAHGTTSVRQAEPLTPEKGTCENC